MVGPVVLGQPSTFYLALNKKSGKPETGHACGTIPPVATKPWMMTMRSPTPVWEEALVFAESYRRLLAPESLVLFELVDFAAALSRKEARKVGVLSIHRNRVFLSVFAGLLRCLRSRLMVVVPSCLRFFYCLLFYGTYHAFKQDRISGCRRARALVVNVYPHEIPPPCLSPSLAPSLQEYRPR